MRGLAAALVLFNHLVLLPVGGGLGVEMFFALSGFLITGLLLGEHARTGRIDFARFYGRRCLRLLPAYTLMVGLYLLIRYLFAPEQPPVGPGRFLYVLLLSRTVDTPVLLLGHVWTLSIEWQFYLIWPFTLWAVLRLGGGRRTIVAIAATVIAVLWLTRLFMYPGLRFEGLLVGAILACLDPGRHPARPGPAEQVLALAALTGLGYLVLRNESPSFWLPPGVGVAAAPILSAALIACAVRSAKSVVHTVFDNPVLTWLGRISYGLYCYHFPIVGLLYIRGYGRGQMLVAGLLALPLADLSWRYVEAPLLRLVHRRRTLSPTRAPAPGPAQ